jgi:hypothetical protein
MCPYFYLFSQKSLEVVGFWRRFSGFGCCFWGGFEAEIEPVLGDLGFPDAIWLVVSGWAGSDLVAKSDPEIDLFLGFFGGFARSCGVFERIS